MKKKKIIIIKPRSKILVYAVVIGWLFMVMAVSYAIIKDTENAGEIMKGFSKTSPIWDFAFGVI